VKLLEKDALDYLRIYKHDVLNYMQVLLGYLQIKKPEMAYEYLKEAIVELQDVGTIMSLGLPKLAWLLLLTKNRFKEKQIILDLKNLGDLSVLAESEERIIEIFEALLVYLEEWLSEYSGEKKMALTFIVEERPYAIFSLPKGIKVEALERVMIILRDLNNIFLLNCCSLSTNHSSFWAIKYVIISL
jgi:hypothetical protein